MHGTVPSPLSERLAVEVEDNAERTPQEDQTHVEHDWWQVPIGNDPRRDELAETISPHVLVDSDRHEDRSRNGLVRVDGVGRRDGRDGGDLDAGAGISDDNWSEY